MRHRELFFKRGTQIFEMKYAIIFLALIALHVSAARTLRCLSTGVTCSPSEDCCSGYCSSGQCTEYTLDEEYGNPCDRKLCPGGQCIVRNIQCIRAPCPPLVTCIYDSAIAA